jgi:hypothetical protein
VRLLRCLLASVLLNAFLWVLCPRLSFHPTEQSRNIVVSTIRIERRSVPHPRARRRSPVRLKPSTVLSRTPRPRVKQKREVPKKTLIALVAKQQRRHWRPHAQPKPPQYSTVTGPLSFTTRQVAKLKLPVRWDKQDFANGAAADTTMWLDFSKARGATVPRVFLLHLKTSYLSGPTLTDAIHDIVGNLHDEGAKVYVSRAQRVCGGKRRGWFLSYEKPNDDPPLQFEGTLFVAGDTVYRATYSRPDGQPEDPKTRAALNTLCPLE